MMSMTGYGTSSWSDKTHSIEVEIRAVNSRFFKFSSRIPPQYAARETEIKNFIMKKISRGAIQLTLDYTNTKETNAAINTELLTEYYRVLSETCQKLNAPVPAIDRLISLPDVVTQKCEKNIPDFLWNETTRILDHALNQINYMRSQEGKSIASELLNFCHSIERHAKDIENITPEILAKFKQRVFLRMKEFLREDSLSVNEQDIVKELAIFSEKVDINEELSRLKSHLSQFRETVAESDPIGKKLEFLTQEMLRESNTIASKANNAECSQLVVNIKNELEKMREQIQNIE